MTNTKNRHSETDRTSSLTIVAISDTQELHREIDVPPGDLLIHAGDFTMFSKNASAILDFNEWLGELPHRWKVCIPRNHEFFLEADPSRRRLNTNATMLINEGVKIAGLKIWGSPTTPLYGGAFGMSSPVDRTKLWAKIPGDVDILITHAPPYGILDQSPGAANHAGCPQLLDAVQRLKPKLHIFGHAHGAHGVVSTEDTLFVNAALQGIDGDLNQEAVVLRLPGT